MYDVTLTITPAGKPATAYAWDDVSKVQAVTHLEDRLIKVLGKLNDMATKIASGKAPKQPATNPVEVVAEFVITKDGAKWHRSTFEWPNMGDEQQAMLLGLVDGELATLPGETRGKGKKK